MFNSLVKNPRKQEIVVAALNHLFVFPANSSFLMSDIDRMEPLLPRSPEEGYNLIVIDPPWENKSVQRLAGYPTLPNRRLLGLPIRQLAHRDGALVALWVTNREKLREFVETELLPKWGVKLVSTWIWLKVGSNGAMISPLENAHHRPYEVLLLGYLFPLKEFSPEMLEGGSEPLSEAFLEKHGIRKPPEKHVIVSIPGEHSRKPSVGRLLFPHVPSSSHASPSSPASSTSPSSPTSPSLPSTKVRPLELFARNLLPDWFSWGNEPLRFQFASYFKPKGGL